ncbi:hypothetical protein PWG71_00695 [Nocardiopsis sp. N85]|uniref:hypothetical protein n=1 Tax=Nocardiopsis sp. N85 TaxID=3029400 RepID=UPI00237F171D|nr:hypothetical protein [Nocardiopsis sp. N85]MDE3719889.1 hypothetical protein [Nocardiopsis sp. N85]
MTATEQDRSLRRIGTALLDAAPEDWIKLRLVYAGLADCESIHLEALLPDGAGVGCVPPLSLLAEFRDLRAGMARPRAGTWYTVYYDLERPARYRVRYDHDNEPDFDEPRDNDSYLSDLEHFPRERAHMPDWLLERLEGGLVPESVSPWMALATPGASREYRIDPGDMTPEEMMDTVQEIADRTVAAVWGEWHEIVIDHKALVCAASSRVEVARADGREWDLLLPEVARLLSRLRTGMYQPGKGTWFAARLTVKRSREIGVHFDHGNHPGFDVEPDPRDFHRDAVRFPRTADHMPDWLLERLGRAQRMIRAENEGRDPFSAAGG